MNFGPYIVGATIIHLCLLVIHVPFCSGFRAYAKSNFLRCTGFLRRQWAIEREKRRHFRRSSLLLLWRLFSPLFTPYGLEDGSCSGLERRWGLEYGRGSRTLCARSLSLSLCRWCARERTIALQLSCNFACVLWHLVGPGAPWIALDLVLCIPCWSYEILSPGCLPNSWKQPYVFCSFVAAQKKKEQH